MTSSKNWVSRRGLIRHYGISRGVAIVRVYSRSRKRRVVVKREEAEAVRRYRVEVVKRACEDCRTRKTPLWRKGPSGRRTLCNACGIRHRRKMRRLQANCDAIKREGSSSSSTSATAEEGLSYEELKQRQKEKQMKMLLLLDWTNKNSRETMEKKIKKSPIKMAAKKAAAEDEEAALLLLSLSSSAILLR